MWCATGYRIDFQNAKIIDREQNRKKLKILEVLHMKTNEQNMNKKEDLNKIKNHYDWVLSKIRKHNNRKKEIKKSDSREIYLLKFFLSIELTLLPQSFFNCWQRLMLILIADNNHESGANHQQKNNNRE
jgi:hypothetical protein